MVGSCILIGQVGVARFSQPITEPIFVFTVTYHSLSSFHICVTFLLTFTLLLYQKKIEKKRAKFVNFTTQSNMRKRPLSNGRRHIQTLKRSICVTTQITDAKRLGYLEHVCKIAPNIETVLPKITIRNPSQSGSVLTILVSF